ncbi:hypothetical protein C8F04DRAFT_1300355 [Mycena alexandri]|uniref:Uncharacterized protein n=1 Tax=Mycena alexandri TaxID=1745969 RepID=A0AAD6WVW5_9AGAR|nr:hypothetical protein C8F04DRAFT_1300355 [Mycena alexandri]
MAQFTFRAYMPPRNPPQSSDSPPDNHRLPAASSFSGFRAYVPSTPPTTEPTIFAQAVPRPSVEFKFANPSPTYHKRGSYQHDLDSGQAEETTKSVSFLLKEVEPNRGKTAHEWTAKHIYVCARMGTGGKSKYVPKREQIRKIPNKRIDCPCRVVGKSYPGTTTILGKYEDSHSHPIGSENLTSFGGHCSAWQYESFSAASRLVLSITRISISKLLLLGHGCLEN